MVGLSHACGEEDWEHRGSQLAQGLHDHRMAIDELQRACPKWCILLLCNCGHHTCSLLAPLQCCSYFLSVSNSIAIFSCRVANLETRSNFGSDQNLPIDITIALGSNCYSIKIENCALWCRLHTSMDNIFVEPH